ncbi:MFS transporter [Agromyces seonyuensis]|uniref:MFS transporter n=1 Tax=Agromyces seonyuensis TaxID=2662446 RepID=A0A6I4NV45_9MICO|nr:MFS transporter [Agromyces seonyuensis]MWB98170.1 MFS transporter [Agromyces seonyuensis]
MSASTPAPAAAAPPIAKAGAIVGFLIFCELASGFVQGYYTPLLPRIADHLAVSDADITWFMTVQTLAAAVSVPLLSKLGDIFGHRRMLRIAVVAVLIGTLLVALAPNLALVLVGRALIGPLAVWLPLEIALVHNRISGETARRSIGLLVSTLTFGAVLGTVAAGIVGEFPIPLAVVLLVPALFVVVSAFAVYFKVPESTTRTGAKIDVLGFVLLGVAMIALLWGLRMAAEVGFADPGAFLPLAAAVVVFAVFVWWELRVDAPAIDIRLVTSRSLGPVYIAGFSFGLVMFGATAPLTTFLGSDPAEVGYGFAVSSGGLSAITAAVTLLATLGAAFFAPIAKRIGIRTVLLIGAGAAGLGSLVQVCFHDELWQIWVGAVICGIGYGLLLGALPALVAELAPSNSTGIAAGVYNSLRTLGGAVAGAVFALLLTATADAAGIPAVGGYVLVWATCTLAFVVAFIAICCIRIPARVETGEPAPTAVAA